MPLQEKLKNIQQYEKNIKSYTLRLVKNELGNEKQEELRSIWQKNSKSVSVEGGDEEKYETAYGNYLQTYISARKFMEKHQGDKGVEKFNQAAISSMKKTGATPSNVLAKTVMPIRRKASFQTIARELAYRLQVFSPFSVDQLDEDQMVVTLTPCKIASSNLEFCNYACQSVIRVWLESQFGLNMVSTQEGSNCTIQFKPFDA
jgi:hypothetical protein